MHWTDPPGTENQPGYNDRPGQEGFIPSLSLAHPESSHPATQDSPSPGPPRELKIDKSLVVSTTPGLPRNLEVFTLTLGTETIELLPFKNWSQLDHFKWTVRGKLPAEPAGLEIAVDHVRISGETVALNDPAGCAKLERLFNEWLHFERETLELARHKALSQPLSAAPESSSQPGSQPLRFQVEVDKRAQVHIHCLQGRDTLASIGLTLAGFSSLCQQGLMRKPHALETGALHNWVELDGELFSFESGKNDAARLEQVLNERYIPAAATNSTKEVLVFMNAASPTGFDIQFPVIVGGAPDNHRHHLTDQTLELLQDPDHCGLLHREIIIKLIPPNLVFKQKTPDGGEQYFAWRPEYTVSVVDEAGVEKTMHLSQPLNLLRLGPADLTAVFNHPSVNRHMKAAPAARAAGETKAAPAAQGPRSQPPPQPVPPPPPRLKPEPPVPAPKPPPVMAEVRPATSPSDLAARPAPAEAAPKPVVPATPPPNLWLKDLLARPALEHDWFACLAYSKIAQRFGNSSEGVLGPAACWFISLGESADIADPDFKGIFLTEKGSLGFLNQSQMARFCHGVAFLGPRQEALEGIEVALVAVGLDARQRVLFIVNDNYHAHFGVAEAVLTDVLTRLSQQGAVVMSVTESLASREPIEVVWTVPADQPDLNEPQALESVRPSA